MTRYIIYRLLEIIPILLGISLMCFFLFSLVPGDPVELLITANPNVKPEDVSRLKKIYGLDQPIIVRYFKWLIRTAKGDLGWSRTYKRRTSQLLKERLPNTLKLLTIAFTLSFLVAIPIGIYSARKQYSFFDYLINIGVFAGISVPTFWIGLMLILIFSVKLNWLPPGGMMTIGVNSILDKLKHLILPTIVLSIHSIAGWTRYMRASMLEEIRQDYVLVARAKGLSEKTIIYKHTLRNALIPIITLMALSIPGLFGGALLTETIFSWPGMGRLIYDSIMGNDYYVAMISFMLLSFLTIFFNLIADIVYAIVNPRIRYN